MPLEIRGAHFLIRSAQLVRGTNTLRIGPGVRRGVSHTRRRVAYVTYRVMRVLFGVTVGAITGKS